MTRHEYSIALAASLRRFALTHALYDVLLAVAHFEERKQPDSPPQFATIPLLMFKLSCTYQNIAQHLLKSPDLFQIDGNASPRQITLSTAGKSLLRDVAERVDAIAKSQESAA